MRILVLIGTLLLLPSMSLAAGTVYFNPSWALKTKEGQYIDIVSLSTKETKAGEVLLVYTTSSGREGFLPAKDLENDEELIAAIKEAKEQLNKLHEQPYKPVRNRRPASSSRNYARSSGPTSSIVTNCKQEWGTNYRMVDYCVKKQTGAHNRVSRMGGSILKRCREEWGNNYRMVEYCVEKQTEAKRRVDRY